MNLPIGVTILAVLQLISGIFTTLGGLYILIFRTAIFQRVSELENVPQAHKFITAFGVFLLIAGLIGLLIAYGLFSLKDWAWLTALILNCLSILSSLLAVLFNQNRKSGDIIGLVITGVIVYYLLRPEVKRAFGKN